MSIDLVIVQPYVPRYRVPFFEQLVSLLKDRGVDCRIVAGIPDAQQSMRRDESSNAPWLQTVPLRRLEFRGRALQLGGSRSSWARADAVILPLHGSLLDVYKALWGAGRSRRRVGLWGHIDSYVNDWHPVDQWLETRQARAADHIFAYTPGGTRFAVEQMRVDPSKVTTVMNSVDTDALLRNTGEPGAVGLGRAALPERPSARTLAYIGGLDGSKRIDLLAAVLDEIWLRDPNVHLLVAGDGSQSHLLSKASGRGQATLLGHADDALLRLVGTRAGALLMPGRVGLVAVHALALGLPIVTTSWKYHAPEFEYLVEGITKFTSEDSPAELADLALRVLSENRRTKPGTWEYPTLADMVGRFSDGVIQMLK